MNFGPHADMAPATKVTPTDPIVDSMKLGLIFFAGCRRKISLN